MTDTMTPIAMPAIERLDWECRHFGFSVARPARADLSDAALAATLLFARREGVRLLVWSAEGGRDVPPELLDQFAGTLIDRKATFCRSLQPDDASDHATSSPRRRTVLPYTGEAASQALIDLAISAGAYSRFRVDTHFPREQFEAMYRRWIERSVTGEMADVVLVVPMHQDDPADCGLGGMITLSESAGVGSIGLIAVAAEVRGAGIGAALMDSAHHWMRDRRARESQVVTQLANLPACRLYERSGYRLSHLQHIFHFWL